MFKAYLDYFLTGTSNTLHSFNFEKDFDLNSKGDLSEAQKQSILSAVRVEKNVNLFFALLAAVFLVASFLYGVSLVMQPQDMITPPCVELETDPVEIYCPEPYIPERSPESISLLFGVTIFVSVVVILGIYFNLILPYKKSKLFKVHSATGKLTKKIADFDTGVYFQIKIDKANFLLSKSLYSSFEDGLVYTIHWIATPREKIIISAKLV